MSEVNLCECGCGHAAPIAERNWHKKGIKKGQPMRFICGHHRRGKKQSRAEKIKRSRAWGVEAVFSPYLPDDRVTKWHKGHCRWYVYDKNGSSIPHAKVVYEHHFGKVPEGYVVHHKSGRHTRLEDDSPDNLMAITQVWNLHYLPRLAQGFGVDESVVTECYIKAAELHPEHLVFMEVCRMLIQEKERPERKECL